MTKGITILLCFLTFSCIAQEETPVDSLAIEDSLTIDVVEVVEVEDTVRGHSIKTAVILSAALPGAGQVYNHLAMPKGKKKAFWKVPLIYAGLGATTYFLINNQQRQKALRNEYTLRLEGKTGDPQWSSYDAQGVLQLYDQSLRLRDLSILAVGFVYLLQVVDAGVEAHFVSFDVSPDLTLRLDPVLMDYRTAGLRLSLGIR